MASEFMHQLSTAASFHEQDENCLEQKVMAINYKTGAHYEGKIVNYKREGNGIFTWPNGCKYEGQYNDNLRHGKGKQTWSDGSVYTGDFVKDLRHGEGTIEWSSGESYQGTFFRDRCHGKGSYHWPDGSSFTGSFYMDKKEGYGTFYFANGDMFQGLYKEDEREGPGIVTYTDGRQDVGLWVAEKLVKLCSSVSRAFSIKSHTELEYKEDEKCTYINLAQEDYPSVSIDHIINPLPPLDYPPQVDLSQRVDTLYNEALDYRSLAVNRKLFDAEFFKNFSSSPMVVEDKVKAWNSTPRMMMLQKHVYKHYVGQKEAGFDVEAILRSDRENCKPMGPLELQSQELIMAAMAGDKRKVEMFLSSGKIHPDVSDSSGHTALIGATVNWHIDVINILLNNGADVNKLNDEGCSALSAGTVFYYPIEGFLHNIAEKSMKPPPDITSLKRDNQTKSILTNTREHRASRLNQINRIRSQSTVSVPAELAPKSVDDLGSEKSSTRKISFVQQLSLNQNLEVPDADNNINDEEEDGDSAYGDYNEEDAEEAPAMEGQNGGKGYEDFDSNQSIRNFQIVVSEEIIERCATQLSQNELITNRETSDMGEDRARKLAVQINFNEKMKDTLDLLLRRGADPNASSVPIPVIFFAIKSADVDMVRQLLMKGANPNTHLSAEHGGLSPLHIACAIPGDEGVEMTKLLLDALADPDARAADDDSYLNRSLEEEWSKDPISDEAKQLLGGRTALHIACARDDNYKNASRVIRILLEHKANTSLICNGFSPLALAIASGNDFAIDELLAFGADPSLPLTHGVGSAFCVANNPDYEHRRTVQARIQLVDKLIRAGADILAPIAIGPKRITGTAVDYAYYMFNQDRRIAHMPYHALTPAERETYNARRKLLSHVGDMLRVKAVEREKKRILEDEKVGVRSQSASMNFVYIGAGAKLPPGVKTRSAALLSQGQVKFETSDQNGNRIESPTRSGILVLEGVEAKLIKNVSHHPTKTSVRKPLFKYCYECGRSVGVRLVACTRCKEVFYCSKACKLKAWNARHKEECIRVGGRSRSPSPKHRGDSPTAITTADKSKRVSGTSKITVPVKGLSKSADVERRLAKHKFRTGSPPNYEYVLIDNYSHN